MIVFHIRTPKPKGRGTRRLTVGFLSNEKTFCGEAPTDHDIRAGWQADPVGKYVPCPRCIEARKLAK